MSLVGFYRSILTLSMRALPRNSAYAFWPTTDTIYIYIYHAKSRLNTPVWGSLRSPNNCTNKKLTICRKGGQSLQACNYVKGRNHCRNMNDSFGNGFHMLKDHLLNPLMTGQCLHKSFHSHFLQNSFEFQKVLHLKDLNRHLECTE